MTLMDLREQAHEAFCEHMGGPGLTRHGNLQAAHEAYLLDPRTTRFLDVLRRQGYRDAFRGWDALSDGNSYREVMV